MVGAIHRATRNWPWQLMTTVAIFIVSIGGVFYALHTTHASDGGRGGAIGCAITFFMLFTGRPTAANALEGPFGGVAASAHDPLVLQKPVDLPDAIRQIEGLKEQMGRLRAATASMLDQAASGRYLLAAASVFSTLMWGFGDSIAAYYGAK